MRGKVAKRLRREVREKIDVVNHYYRDYETKTSQKFVTVGTQVRPIEVSHLTLKEDCLKKLYAKAKKTYLQNKRTV